MGDNIILLKKNQEISLEITDMTTEGAGVGHHQGLAVFVPGTAPGDSLRCRIVKVLKNYCFGMTVELLRPSPARVAPDCPYFAQCGGCVYRHIRYEEEILIKTQGISQALRRIGGFSQLALATPLVAPTRCAYRNKAQIPLGVDRQGNLTLGFYAPHSHRIVNIEKCLLQPEGFTLAMDIVRAWHKETQVSVYNESTHSGLLRHLYLRHGEKTGELMVCIVVNGKELPFGDLLVARLQAGIPTLTSVVLNSNTQNTNVILGKHCQTLWGKDEITDTLCGLQFSLSPLSFYQINPSQAERLYAQAATYAALTGKECLMDLYCGAGTIGLSMAHNAKKLIGVEIIPEAVENANRNAVENGIANAEFLCADAAEAATLLESRGEKPDVIVVDPPRKGLTPSLIDTMVRMAPSRIVYVSCDPATLARDLKLFAASGYPPTAATPCDLFPGTAHVECVVLLLREDPDFR